MNINKERVALNPLQYMATDDGWLDPRLAPPLASQLAFAKAQGFHAVQTDIPARMDHVEYRRHLDDAGFVAGPGYISVLLPEDRGGIAAAVEAAKQTARANAAVGSELTFLAMGMDYNAPRITGSAAVGHAFAAPRLELVIDVLGQVAEGIRAEGVTPALHPHVGTWVETESETRQVLEAIPSSVLAFGPDTGHLMWAGADVVSLLSDYAPRIAGVHIKDLFFDTAARGRRERLPYRDTVLGGLWTEPGTGDVDFAELFDALPTPYQGWTVIEVDRGNQPTAELSIILCGEWLSRQ